MFSFLISICISEFHHLKDAVYGYDYWAMAYLEAICWTVGVKPISLRINCTSCCLDPLLLGGGRHSHYQWLCCYFMPSAWGPGGQVLFVGKSVFLYSRLAVQLTSFIGKANLWIIDNWLCDYMLFWHAIMVGTWAFKFWVILILSILWWVLLDASMQHTSSLPCAIPFKKQLDPPTKPSLLF